MKALELVVGKGDLRAGFFPGADRDPAVNHTLGEERILRWRLHAFGRCVVCLGRCAIARVAQRRERKGRRGSQQDREQRERRT